MQALLGTVAMLLTWELIVDQVDGGHVAVELPDQTVLVVPATLLPPATAEGDRLVIRVRRSRVRWPWPRANSKTQPASSQSPGARPRKERQTDEQAQ